MNDNEEQPLIEPAPAPLRLPVIRHLRTIWCTWRVLVHEERVERYGLGIPTGFDQKVLAQMWKGIV